MRSVFLAIVLWCGLVLPVRANAAPPTDADAAAIRAVIVRQIDAFRRNDAVAAWSLAAPAIQKMFGDPAHFLAMVKLRYGPVYHPGSYTFGPLNDNNGQVVQHVEITGLDGRLNEALYTMEREAGGAWRVRGCVLEHLNRIAT